MRSKELVCLTNALVFPGAEVTVITSSKDFREADISEVFVDDPWWGITALTVHPYTTALAYSTFATWGEIMFNATRTAFRAGALVWGGKIMAHLIPVGSKVLVS